MFLCHYDYELQITCVYYSFTKLYKQTRAFKINLGPVLKKSASCDGVVNGFKLLSFNATTVDGKACKNSFLLILVFNSTNPNYLISILRVLYLHLFKKEACAKKEKRMFLRKNVG